MVLVHGFSDTWRSWELVLPALERHHEVLAPTLAGHAGGPALTATGHAGGPALTATGHARGPAVDGALTTQTLADGIERAMDEAGFAIAHIVGNSLGGWVSLQLAARGRARTVVAFAPAGGWEPGDPYDRERHVHFTTMRGLAQAAAPYADAIVASENGRRRATEHTTVNFEHIPGELLAHQIRGVAACEGLPALLDLAERDGFPLDAERIGCPLRIVWGTADRILRWPSSAALFRRTLPHAEWVELPGIGHCPQLDVPLETAQLILGFTAG